MRREASNHSKVVWLMVAGLIGLIVGSIIGWSGLCPVVKRIWTPSWVLFSGGWCFLLLGFFYLVMDVLNRKAWAFPLKVIGMNSIAAYCIAHLFDGFIHKNLLTHFGQKPFQLLGNGYQVLLEGAAVLLAYWLLLLWMYRRKLFLRV